MSDLLKSLQKNEEFKAVMEEMLKHRPIVTAFSICRTKDEQEQNIEAIKYYTALRNGFDLLYHVLTGKPVIKGD